VQRLLTFGRHLLAAIGYDLCRHVGAQLQQPLNKLPLIGDHRQAERSLHVTTQHDIRTEMYF